MISEYSVPLIYAFALATFLTILAKTLPITLLDGDSLPQILKKWLDFVPAAVMGALVGPDVFIYDGKFNLSFSNLFLIVSIPTFFIAWLTKNFFITIASGIILIIIARYFGLS